MLKVHFKITFYLKEVPDGFITELEEMGFGCIIIDRETEFLNMIKSNHIVVLDGYNFDILYQKKIKATGAKLVYIDDLHEIEFVADLIINHAPGVKPLDYQAQPYTEFALGLKYALLRPAFLEKSKNERKINKIESIMICFGGSDPKNFTQSALNLVLEFSHFKKIIVVTGEVYNSIKEFEELAKCDNRVVLKKSLKAQEMIDVMLESDLVIVPTSGLLFEALALGCIAISGHSADNQKYVYQYFKDSELIIDAGSFSKEILFDAITEALRSTKCHEKPIDSETQNRVLRLFEQLNKEFFINLRKATINDLDLTYKWASNPELRRFSFQQHKIKKQEHASWFKNKITNKNCYFFIFDYKDNSIGSIRFDIKEREATISFLLDLEYQGQGFGQIILKKGIELLIENITEHKLIQLISGEVMKNNFASIKSFERLGFVKTEQDDKFKFEKWL
jgi:UDP-2,4-diacetamido-2,4,6-trideoxy-beta-L-altropyranose hydrolase